MEDRRIGGLLLYGSRVRVLHGFPFDFLGFDSSKVAKGERGVLWDDDPEESEGGSALAGPLLVWGLTVYTYHQGRLNVCIFGGGGGIGGTWRFFAWCASVQGGCCSPE